MSSEVPAERRRSIVVMASNDLKTVKRDPNLVDLLDDSEVSFVDVGGAEGTWLTGLLRDQDLLRPGTVVVQSPYNPDRYLAADLALVELAVEKFLIMTRLAQLLGATKVEFTDVHAEMRKASTAAKGAVQTVASNVSSEGTRSIETQVTQKLTGVHKFDGGEPDIEAARELLRRHRLVGDPQLHNLIELRGGPDPVRNQELSISGSREAAGNLTAALRVAGGPLRLKLAGFSMDVANQWSSKLEVDVTTKIEFGFGFG